MMQTTNTIVMVRPANFGFNPETAENNAFQNNTDNSDTTAQEIAQRARDEFDAMVTSLRGYGVDVIVIEDSQTPIKTDAVFPNNWFSTHSDGQLYLYPMYSPNRRLERRESIIEHLQQGHKINTLNRDLLRHEDAQLYLEGTGSMILDRQHKIIYACYSERTDPQLLTEYGEMIGYRVVGYDAVDQNGVPYYHTNVIMHVGTEIAILCTESIVDPKQKEDVLQSLRETNKTVVEISREQVNQFAGNMLELKGGQNEKLLIMSSTALKSLTKEQIHIIEKYNIIVSMQVPTIEYYGGGSVRCMMAEIFSEKVS